MICHLRNIRSDPQGYEALAGLATETEELRYGSVEVSFASVSWFDANMSAALGAILAAILDRYNTVSIVDLSWGQQSILERNGFLGGFGYALPTAWGDTVIPYFRFKISEANRFYDYLEEHLPSKGLPEMTSAFALRFQQSLGEIFINTQTHSQSALGVFVCGQFFPAKQRLDITIADAGITIPGNVSQRFNVAIAPVAALRWALVEGHTTKKNTPGGFGLKLLRQFVMQNRGRIQIASGAAFWEYDATHERIVPLREKFPGTAVTLEVNTADTTLYDSDSAEEARTI
jgi:hypothetical protein